MRGINTRVALGAVVSIFLIPSCFLLVFFLFIFQTAVHFASNAVPLLSVLDSTCFYFKNLTVFCTFYLVTEDREFGCALATFSLYSTTIASPPITAELVIPPALAMFGCPTGPEGGDDGLGEEGDDIAHGADSGRSYAGKILVIVRGQCTFEAKVSPLGELGNVSRLPANPLFVVFCFCL